MRHLRAFGRFWWDFIVGDDWRVAAGVVTLVAIEALAVASGAFSTTTLAVIMAAGAISVAGVTIAVDGLRIARERRGAERP
jgi:hypothetical protein